MRRSMTASLRKPLSQTRSYIDYHHRKYPIYPLVAFGAPAIYLGCWVLFLRMGSVWTQRSEWKKDMMRGWRRRIGTGYKWDFGPEIKSIYTNLPDRAV